MTLKKAFSLFLAGLMLLSSLTGCSLFKKDDVGGEETKEFYSIGRAELAEYSINRPDDAEELTSTAASNAHNERSTSAEKSTCPGVSIRLTCTSR